MTDESKEPFVVGRGFDNSKPATPQQRRKIGVVIISIAIIGIVLAVIIALSTKEVTYGAAALIAWGIAIMVFGNFVALGLKLKSRRK